MRLACCSGSCGENAFGHSSGAEYWLSSTDQILVTRDRNLLEHPELRGYANPIADRADLKTFTDAHHNLFRILK